MNQVCYEANSLIKSAWALKSNRSKHTLDKSLNSWVFISSSVKWSDMSTYHKDLFWEIHEPIQIFNTRLGIWFTGRTLALYVCPGFESQCCPNHIHFTPPAQHLVHRRFQMNSWSSLPRCHSHIKMAQLKIEMQADLTLNLALWLQHSADRTCPLL